MTAKYNKKTFFKNPYWRKFAMIATGHGIWNIISWIFNNIAYPAALLKWGYLWGTVVMTTLSCIICAGVLVHYQHSKNDWVGAGLADALRTADMQKEGRLKRTLAWMIRKGDIFMFFVLSIFQDPMITAAYFTRGNFKGLTAKIWAIFIASTIVSNLYWAARLTVIIAVLKAIWHFSVGLI